MAGFAKISGAHLYLRSMNIHICTGSEFCALSIGEIRFSFGGHIGEKLRFKDSVVGGKIEQ